VLNGRGNYLAKAVPDVSEQDVRDIGQLIYELSDHRYSVTMRRQQTTQESDRSMNRRRQRLLKQMMDHQRGDY